MLVYPQDKEVVIKSITGIILTLDFKGWGHSHWEKQQYFIEIVKFFLLFLNSINDKTNQFYIYQFKQTSI